MDVDVAIVGAGVSGLSCARRVADAGLRVAVLEARDRVGGRTLTVRDSGVAVDLGGQWIGPGQRRVLALAAELGLATFPTHHAGRKVLVCGDRRSEYEGPIPSMSRLGALEMKLSERVLERYEERVSTEHPERTPGAARLDAQSVEELLRLTVSRVAKGSFEAAIRAVFGCDPSELSLLYFLWYCRAGGGFMHLVGVEGGAQERRFVDGAQGLSLALARSLGEAILLEHPVTSVRQTEDAVTVTTARGLDVRARRVVIALAPPLVDRIDFEPMLPARRRDLSRRMVMGAAIKCIVDYPRAFWRERGLSGEVVFDEGPLSAVFDNSSPDGARPALLGFIVGRNARAWSERGEEERRDAVLEALARAFGDDARRPSGYVERDWSLERWSAGCPVGTLPPGVMLGSGAVMRTPVGRVHWAGTETATEYPGYIEGAIQAGERAADEVLEGSPPR